MIASLQRSHRNYGMAVIGCAYMNDIKSASGQQLTEICINGCILRTICFRRLLCAFLYNVAKSHHFGIFLTGQTWHMFAVCDTTATDNSNFEFVRHELFLLDWHML
ncbi:hypothetical protein D3C75_969930 [compost metagenome]